METEESRPIRVRFASDSRPIRVRFASDSRPIRVRYRDVKQWRYSTVIYEKTNDYNESDAAKSNRTRRPILDERIGRQIELFGQRLTEVIGKEPVRAFARRANMSEGAIRQYMNGNRYPDLDFLAAIVTAGEVNLLWLATGEGPKHPQTRGSPDSVQEKSADYVCGPQKGWIRKAVEAVERMRPDAPADRKAVAVEQVYERLVQSDGAADMIEVMRIIQAALEG